MDATMTEAAPAVDEGDVMTPRATLQAIADQCALGLTERIARRFSTRDALKNLEKRARALLEQDEIGHAFDEDFKKVIITADSVFAQLIAEVEPAGHA